MWQPRAWVVFIYFLACVRFLHLFPFLLKCQDKNIVIAFIDMFGKVCVDVNSFHKLDAVKSFLLHEYEFVPFLASDQR